MSISLHRYKCAVDNFEQELYPAIQYAFEAINAHDSRPLNEALSVAINTLQSEFYSLVTYERKLIFPAVLSLLGSSVNDRKFLPDIAQILNLCNAKELRLVRAIDQINIRLEEILHKACDTICTSPELLSLQQLTDIFQNRFIPKRRHWQQLLLQLESHSKQSHPTFQY